MARVITHEFQVGLTRRHYETVDWTPPPKGMVIGNERVMSGLRWNKEKEIFERINPDGPFQDGDILYVKHNESHLAQLRKETLMEIESTDGSHM